MLKRSDILEDLRLIDMYEEATFDLLPLPERIGNWVQKFHEPSDAGQYVVSQFYRYQEIEAFVREKLGDGAPLFERSGEL